jgi:hypothetical protein
MLDSWVFMLFLFNLMVDLDRALSLDESDPADEVIHRLLIAVEFGDNIARVTERHDIRHGACDLQLQMSVNLCWLEFSEALESPVLDRTYGVAHVLGSEAKEEDGKRGVCRCEQGDVGKEGVIDGVHMVEEWEGGRE